MNGLQIKTNSPIRTLINKKHTRNAYTCIIFKEDVHISIVENPRPSYFCATIKTLKQHDEEKINTIILFCCIRCCSRQADSAEKPQAQALFFPPLKLTFQVCLLHG